ncbi:MAG TPA: hypothetical protein VNF73_04760 [Candidatus Saccharimonadales bacterium]|nr:hypothetical protein [Candidatus Saccharimonadales bacterium]
MRRVTVLIFHAPARGPGSREEVFERARAALAEHHRAAFLATGAATATIVAEPPDQEPFGVRLRRAVREHVPAGAGLIVLGSGAMPLIGAADRRRFLDVAAGAAGHALANNRFSCDALAVANAAILSRLPPVRGDNELPRWLADEAGIEVEDLSGHWRPQVDLDSPLDIVLAARDRTCPHPLRVLAEAIVNEPARAAFRAAQTNVDRVMADGQGELVVVGRTSARTLRWLELNARCRVRALVEERGMRTAGEANRRPPRSVLGRLLDLDADGPAGLARSMAELGDAAIVDTRILLAHRLGAEEAAWPVPEDRFASDLLEPDAIADPWLRDLTRSAVTGGLPILLGGHSLVGPGVRLLGRGPRAQA